MENSRLTKTFSPPMMNYLYIFFSLLLWLGEWAIIASDLSVFLHRFVMSPLSLSAGLSIRSFSSTTTKKKIMLVFLSLEIQRLA